MRRINWTFLCFKSKFVLAIGVTVILLVVYFNSLSPLDLLAMTPTLFIKAASSEMMDETNKVRKQLENNEVQRLQTADIRKPELTDKRAPEPIDIPIEEFTDIPTLETTDIPRDEFTDIPRDKFTDIPRDKFTDIPRDEFTDIQRDEFTDTPTKKATDISRDEFTDIPTKKATDIPTDEFTDIPTQVTTDTNSSNIAHDAKWIETLDGVHNIDSSENVLHFENQQQQEKTEDNQRIDVPSIQQGQAEDNHRLDEPSIQHGQTQDNQRLDIPSIQQGQAKDNQRIDVSSSQQRQTEDNQRIDVSSSQQRQTEDNQRIDVSSSQQRQIEDNQRIDVSSSQQRQTEDNQRIDVPSIQQGQTENNQQIDVSNIQQGQTELKQRVDVPSIQQGQTELKQRVDVPSSHVIENFRKIHDTYYLYQGQWIQKPTFHSGNLEHYYLFGAAMSNSSDSSAWDEIRIYGQMHKKYRKQGPMNIRCCMKYKDGYTMVKNPTKQETQQKSLINAFYYKCPVDPRRGKVPHKAAIAFGNLTCESRNLPYVNPIFPQKQKNKLGISCKISYGTLSSEAAIEWLEAMKFLGVDKVITYADVSLNPTARQTLQYYERTGFLDVFPYEQPGKDVFPRTPQLKHGQKYMDARLLIWDAYERMRGYTNFGIIDMDEFLLPSNNKTIKELMMSKRNELIKNDQKDNFAGWYFRSSYFLKTWGKVNASSDLEIGQYLNQTDKEPVFDKQKAIVFNDRLTMYTFTHEVRPKQGFKMYDCPSDEAYLRHYRSCRKEWLSRGNKCMNVFVRVTNYEMINWVNRNIAANIRHVRKQIFGSSASII